LLRPVEDGGDLVRFGKVRHGTLLLVGRDGERYVILVYQAFKRRI